MRAAVCLGGHTVVLILGQFFRVAGLVTKAKQRCGLVYLAPTWSPIPGSGLPRPPPYTEPHAPLSRVKRIIERASPLKLTVEG